MRISFARYLRRRETRARCGRYASTTTDKELRSLFDVAESVGPEVPPSYNVAPTRQVRVVLERAPRREPRAGAERQLRTASVGLVPGVVEGPEDRLPVDQRPLVETTPRSPASDRPPRSAAASSGGRYFEWMKDAEGKKIPYFLHGERPVLAMAALYELWPDPSKAEDDPDRWLWTTTVLTTQATDATGHIHDRSPVILPASFWKHWLDPSITDRDEVQAMVNSIPEPASAALPSEHGGQQRRERPSELLNPVGEDEK
ncbi:SOS response-associated peptidase [Rhodococcus hoagii]|nr:SOS response-associated peptidase [Prescottella equi]